MKERPEEIQKSLQSLREIGDVIGALRALAVGHAASAREAVRSIAVYEMTVIQALDRLAAPTHAAGEGAGLVVVVGVAQGFSGAYPQRIVEQVLNTSIKGAGLLVLGSRTVAMLDGVAETILWTGDLPTRPKDVPALASRLTDVLLEFAGTHPGPIWLVGGRDKPGQPIETRRLWPPEARRSQGAPNELLTNLSKSTLVSELTNEALFATVMRVILEGFMAENEARLEAMARAQDNVHKKTDEIERVWRRARQEEMTTELTELTMGREIIDDDEDR